VNRRLALPVLAVTATALVLTGCTAKHRGSAAPAPTATGDSSSSAPSTGAAPRVPSPLKTSKIEANACDTLSSTDRGDLKLDGGAPRQGPAGPSCTYLEAADPGNQIDVTTVTANKNGLSDVYDTKANDEYFGETQIGGYPAVFAAVKDYRHDGQCGLWIGVTDQLAVQIMVQYGHGPGVQDPCGVATKFGEAVVSTLKVG